MKLSFSWAELEPYLQVRRQQSNKSLVGHKGRFKRLVEWFGDKEFNANNFDAFIYYEVDKAGKSASLYNNYLKLVKHIAAYLGIKQEFEDYHFRDDHSGQPENILTPKQIEQLAECRIKYRYHQKQVAAKRRALVYFLGNVGSRIDETLHLEWNDIKQEDKINFIHFRKEITKNKTGERFVPIPKWLCKMLLNLPHDSNIIFSQTQASNFREELEIRRKMCDIPFAVTPHTFRDSYANNKLDNDIPLEQVTGLLGHSDTRVTYKSYVRVQAKKVARNLNMKDPAFYQDQTFNSYIQLKKEDIEKTHNARVADFTRKEEVNSEGKKVITFIFTER